MTIKPKERPAALSVIAAEWSKFLPGVETAVGRAAHRVPR
jgi:hypothetical protein